MSWDLHHATHPHRQTWDAYFLEIARTAASRATCSRRKHGAVVARKRRIVSTGYNGGPSGYPHCDEGACPSGNGSLRVHDDSRCIAIHAVANALLFASPDQREGATLYSTSAPCFGCAKLIANSGISEVVAAGGRYERWDDVCDFLRATGVRVRLIDGLEGLPVLDLTSAQATLRP